MASTTQRNDMVRLFRHELELCGEIVPKETRAPGQ